MIPAIILARYNPWPSWFWTLGQALSTVVLAGLTGPFKAVFGAIFGALYAPFVFITGLRHMTNAINTQLIADAGNWLMAGDCSF